MITSVNHAEANTATNIDLVPLTTTIASEDAMIFTKKRSVTENGKFN
jgi:hypothetical protein